MSKTKKKLEKAAKLQAQQEEAGEKVLMRFKQNQFYNDQNNPIFEAGKIYEISGRAWIHRWMKRGGEIVDDPKAKAEAKARIPAPEDATPSPVKEKLPENPEEGGKDTEKAPSNQGIEQEFPGDEQE